jgi:hypothetical protein
VDLWWDHAYRTLPVLMRATDMLVCGEDLGFLAPCVHPLMKTLGLIGARPALPHPHQAQTPLLFPVLQNILSGLQSFAL